MSLAPSHVVAWVTVHNTTLSSWYCRYTTHFCSLLPYRIMSLSTSVVLLVSTIMLLALTAECSTAIQSVSIPLSIIGCDGISSQPANTLAVTAIINQSFQQIVDDNKNDSAALFTFVPNVLSAVAAAVNTSASNLICQSVTETAVPTTDVSSSASQSNIAITFVAPTAISHTLTSPDELTTIQHSLSDAGVQLASIIISNNTNIANTPVASPPPGEGNNDNNGSTSLTRGQLIGIVLGSVAAAFLLVALIVLIIYFSCRSSRVNANKQVDVTSSKAVMIMPSPSISSSEQQMEDVDLESSTNKQSEPRPSAFVTSAAYMQCNFFEGFGFPMGV